MRINTLATIAAGILLAPLSAVAAPAATAADQSKIVVKTADLDLSTAAGHAALATRVKRAAGNVCVSDAGELDRLEAHLRFDDCVRKASDRAMGSIPAGRVAVGR